MLSVLIPVYNYDVTTLVNDLQRQCLAEGISFTIYCLDDCSATSFQEKNRQLAGMEGVVYQELSENVGRSRIRNRLAEMARHDYLLFMDCDSKVVRPDYIQKYLRHLTPDTLLYGGRVYSDQPPADPALYFHWCYGTAREQIPVDVRRKTPYHAFMTNNFLIPKATFESIGFDERLTQYGHEDTIFGLELRQRGIRLEHLDNPLEHLGLERVEVFLEKTRKGIDNLYFLWQDNPLIDTRLLRMAQQLKSWYLAGSACWLLRRFSRVIANNLYSSQPKMLYFDLFKLLLLLEKDRESG